MPVYAYRCEACGIQFERTQKFSDAPLTRCPECGKKALRKVYTPVGIVFKGSGFYATDHKSPSGAPRTHNSKSSSDEKAPSESKPLEGTSAETKSGSETSSKTTPPPSPSE